VKTEQDEIAAADGKIVSQTDYDGLGRKALTWYMAPEGEIDTQYAYDGKNRLSSVSNPGSLAQLTKYTYDVLDRPVTVTAQDGSVTSYAYVGDKNSLTNTKLEIDPALAGQTNGNNRLYYTDALGHLVQVNENVTSWQSQTYGQSGQPTYTTTYGYFDLLDDLNLVCQNGTITTTQICSTGTGVQSRSFIYDSLKRLHQAANPESGTTAYSYDYSGNLSTRTDANGTVITFSAYDGMNRATGKSYAPGTGVASTPSVSYTYDSTTAAPCSLPSSGNLKGLLTQVTNGASTTNYTGYDWAGRPACSSQTTGTPTYAMQYTYDLAGLMTTFKLPSGRLQTIAYDTAGRASGVSATYDASAVSYAGAFAYFPNRSLANVSLGPNSLIQQYCQNSRLQIVGVRLGAAGGATTANCANSSDPLNLGFAYGSAGYNNGNLTSELLNAPLNTSQTFTYDAYNRLATAAEGTATWSETYKFDVTGNANASLGNRYVSASSGLSLVPSSFTPTANTNFNSNNQLSIQASTYDSAGSLKTIGGYSFTYDAENRQVSNAVNGSNTYSYDGEGHRVQKVSGGVTTVYVYDAEGEVAAEYSTAPPGPAATLYLTADHLGSTRLTSNAAGTAVGYHDYLPFGEEIPSTVGGRGSLYGETELTQKFTAKERDAETASSAMQALDYFGARYFSGTMGRFASPDPLMGSAKISSPQSWNRYAFVFNNPLRFTDPTGMYTCQGTADQCNQFEKNRASILKSKDSDAVRAANAYGKANTDNGVVVRFADNLGDRGGTASRIDSGLRADPNDSSKFQATLAVTIQSDNIGNQETIAHEGSHVADYQAFVNSIDMAGSMDQSLNITHMATEVRAYELSIQYALSGNGNLNFGPCGGVGQECKFSPGMMPAVRDQKIMDLLADPRNRYTGLNTVLYPELLRPQQK
jgi:RHS repeat-associated protein